MYVWGFVKWFDKTSDFGFLDAGDGDGDIMLHANDLRAFGIPSVAEGARIEVRVEVTARGRRAVEIRDFLPPAGAKAPADAGPLEPACVRWFDRVKGYGFVNAYGRGRVVYLHMAKLREWGFGPVAEGAAIVVRVSAGPDGPTVCEVRDWDYPRRLLDRERQSPRPIATPARGALTDELIEQAGVAIREVVRAGVHDGRHGRLEAAPLFTAALRDPEIEALVGLACHARHVDAIVQSLLGEP